MWKGKRILIGVTGGIAAYKIPLLVREFIKLGAEVKCILTPASSAFVTPLTLATLSKNEVYTDLYNPQTGVWTNHVELGMWADLMIIAPLTASSLAKMTVGHSDNLLLTTYLSAKCPVFVAPAMDLDMFAHESTIVNLLKLEKSGVHIIPVGEGELASGLSGKGRMAEPDEIVSYISTHFFTKELDFSAKKVLITAGPSYESIDPVRFIGNHSTGKMGVAIANEFAQRGANVTLLLGPSSNSYSLHPSISFYRFNTANELLELTQQNWVNTDIGVFSAAVADYKPSEVASQKIKKDSEDLVLHLVKNPDILMWAGANKTKTQLLVGFALETTNEVENAKLKLVKKNLDLIVLNSLNDKGAGFGHDTNKVTLMDKHNNCVNLELLSKDETACKIVNYVQELSKN